MGGRRDQETDGKINRTWPGGQVIRDLRISTYPLLARVLVWHATCLPARAGCHPRPFHDACNEVVGELHLLPAAQLRRQRDRAEADSGQARHGEAEMLEQPPHFALAAFLDDHAVPAVGPLAAGDKAALQLGRPVVQFNPCEQLCDHVLGQLAQHPHRVLALDFEARMHQLVGELARGGEDHQAVGVVVEPPDGNPLGAAQSGQRVEHGGAALGVVAGDDLAFRLVVGQDASALVLEAQVHAAAADLDDVARSDLAADRGSFAVDLHAALGDPFLHLSARTQPRRGQRLMQAFAGRLGGGGLLQAARRAAHGNLRRTAYGGCGAGHIQRISVTASNCVLAARAVSITAPNVWGAPLSANSSRNSGINAVSSGVTRFPSSSNGGNSDSVRSPRSLRKWPVVPNSAGRPGTSRWPIASIQPRSSSVLMMLGLTDTPRMSSMSPRVTGWR